MKKWTVMLIPHDRGERRSFDLNSKYAWAALSLLASAVFATGFLFQRARVTWDEAAKLNAVFQQAGREGLPNPTQGLSAEGRIALESELRSEFEARDEALTSELGRIYDLETEVRLLTGLPPRAEGVELTPEGSGGQGGGGPGEVIEIVEGDVDMLRPPALIYGLSRPSADMMLQEMRMRVSSLNQLLTALDFQEQRISRLPSILPTTETDRYISSRFGNRRDPFTKRIRFHGGLDIATLHGAPIQATAKGVIVKSARNNFYGHYIKIDHENGYETLYGHMSKRLVEVGDIVERGSVIGKVGSTGRSTSSHIHYEVYESGRRINPINYIGH